MKEMVGHTDCSEVELEDSELAVANEDLVRWELCEGATVTKEVDRDLDVEEGGIELGELRSVLTDDEEV